MSLFNNTPPVNPAASASPTAPTTPPKPINPNDDKYRQALANAFMQSAAEPTQTQRVGNMNVRTSPWETLAKLGQSAAAAYMMKGK
jgi:hypothetical protein